MPRTTPAPVAATLVLLLAAGCAPAPAATGGEPGCASGYEAGRDYFPDKVSAQVSTQWQVSYRGSYKVLRVNAGPKTSLEQTDTAPRTYVLPQCGTPAPELTGELAGATVVPVPVRKAVDNPATLLGAFELLAPEALAGYGEFPHKGTAPQHLPGVAKRIKDGTAVQVGHGDKLDVEKVLTLGSQVMFADSGDKSRFDRLAAGGVPVVFYSPFNESPLGSAEQVKLLSLFTNTEAEANTHFDGVRTRYEQLRAKAAAAPKPSVLVGINGHGRDFLAPQNDYLEPTLVRDAGGATVFDLPGKALQRLPMETMVERGATADFWFRPDFVGAGATARSILAAEPRLSRITALTSGKGIDRADPRVYSAAGLANPDKLLADLVGVLHPDLLPGHRLEFLRRIEGG
ncbi:iron complex transport system substrate-binding protein [Crossiella equi]|uniref:Iron complex transport system substrate-binding protein n=1 Tax=Crossiella equi TaxID=130796 RepID=A0ABS5ALB1_9PSEU|nr:ABC transporter substrate-binding protein [Crossiella equi]MBP2477346.1 iron complex transport system substrate-binding protein [Crossiella equi]